MLYAAVILPMKYALNSKTMEEVDKETQFKQLIVEISDNFVIKKTGNQKWKTTNILDTHPVQVCNDEVISKA